MMSDKACRKLYAKFKAAYPETEWFPWPSTDITQPLYSVVELDYMKKALIDRGVKP